MLSKKTYEQPRLLVSFVDMQAVVTASPAGFSDGGIGMEWDQSKWGDLK